VLVIKPASLISSNMRWRNVVIIVSSRLVGISADQTATSSRIRR
jgi:hypothetical protein